MFLSFFPHFMVLCLLLGDKLETSNIFFLIGWVFEISGITFLVITSMKLSTWILDNWMMSLPDGFLKERDSLKKRNDGYVVIGLVLIVAGLTLQLWNDGDYGIFN